jgi:hypothetical protein
MVGASYKYPLIYPPRKSRVWEKMTQISQFHGGHYNYQGARSFIGPSQMFIFELIIMLFQPTHFILMCFL